MSGTVLISQNAAQNTLKKCKVTLTIVEGLRDYARENGLNMSAILENALKSGEFTAKKGLFYNNPPVERFNSENDSFLSEFSSNVELSDNIDFARAYDKTKIGDSSRLPANHQNTQCASYIHVNTNFDKIFSKNDEIMNFFINYRNQLCSTVMSTTNQILQDMDVPQHIVQAVSQQVLMSLLNLNGALPLPTQKPPQQNLSIAEYFSMKERDFREYAKDTGTKTEAVINSYCSYLRKMYGISKPSDLTNYRLVHGKDLNGNQKRALAKMLKFMRFSQGLEEFNGYDLSRFTEYLKEAKLSKTTTQKGRHRNISEEGLKEAFNKISHKMETDFVRQIGKLIYYSGCRWAQLMRVLCLKNKNIEIDGDICIVDGSEAQLGEHKQCIKLYFPVECYSFIKNFKIPLLHCQKGKPFPRNGLVWIAKALDVKLDSGELINSASLRKYNYNVLRVDCKIDKDIADMIQSRLTIDTGNKYYLDADKLCREAYKKAVGIYRRRLPWDSE